MIEYRNYAEGGASVKKPALKSWTPFHFSAKNELDANLNLLRARASSLTKNSPIGAAAVNVLSTNVIGSGLKLFPRVKALTGDEARAWSRKTKAEFEIWASSQFAADFLKRNNFYELQRIAFQSMLVEGDCFCLFKRRRAEKFTPYTLRLQLVEGTRVANPLQGAQFGAEMMIGKNRVVNGIEVDSDGAQVAIWISNRVWNEPSLDATLTFERVKWFGDLSGTQNLLHICADSRPEQFRGAPLLSPAIESLKQLSRYGDAELTSAIIKSFFSIFFTQPLQNYSVNGVLGEREETDEVDVSEYKLGAGTMTALPRGVDVKAIDSSNAQSTFGEFTGAFLKQIGAAIGVPYELLLKNFTASYSASRAALLQAADEFRVRKENFINDFCRPIYEMWLAEAVSTGRIEAEGFFDDPIRHAAWCNADWFNEQNKFLDPVKEMEGVKRRLEMGLTTRQKEAAELCGVDFWDNLEELSQENEELGISAIQRK